MKTSSVTSFKPRCILVPVDFSASSLEALQLALALARRYDARLVLLHVIAPPHPDMLIDATQIERDVHAAAHERLTRLADATKKIWPRTSRELRTGHPVTTIIALASRTNADLIVIGTHGRTGFKRALIGSVAERVVRHAPCPVLTVRPRAQSRRGGDATPFTLEKVLVPVDFSKISEKAVPGSALLAGLFGAEIVLLHVVEKFPIDRVLEREVTNVTMARLTKEAEAGLKRMAANPARPAGVKTSIVVRQGTPFDEICAAAKALGADMIFLTTHGYTGLKHVWLGSTAERVVRHAPCPVLVVR